MQRQCPVSRMYIYMEGSGKLEALNTDSIVHAPSFTPAASLGARATR